MFIQVEPTPNPLTKKFLPGCPVSKKGTVFYQNESEVSNSPLAKRMFAVEGVTSVFFAVAGLASLGLPGLSGFIAEFMVFVGVFSTYWPLAVVAVIGAAITAVYILRLLARSFFGELDPKWDHLTDASPVEKVVGGAFVLILIVVGIWPAPLLDVINNGVAAVLPAL